MESRRSPGPATLRHHEAVLGCLRAAGFPIEMTARLDSYIYGFGLQKPACRSAPPGKPAQVAREIAGEMPGDEYPRLTELTVGLVLQPGYNTATSSRSASASASTPSSAAGTP